MSDKINGDYLRNQPIADNAERVELYGIRGGKDYRVIAGDRGGVATLRKDTGEIPDSQVPSGLRAAPARIDYLSGRIDILEAGQAAGMIGYATKAEMEADLSPPDRSVAMVTNDPPHLFFRKVGESGEGSWEEADDPVSEITPVVHDTARRTADVNQTVAGLELSDKNGFVDPVDYAPVLREAADLTASVSAYPGATIALADKHGFYIEVLEGEGGRVDGEPRSTRLGAIRAAQISGERRGIVVVAHRGFFTPNAPGNTMSALSSCIAAGADVIEADMQVTSDGHVVLYHDSNLNTVTSGSGAIKDKTLADVQSVTFNAYASNPVANQARIPKLSELLRYMKKHGALASLEVKAYRTQADIAAMIGEISAAGLLDSVVIAVNTLSDLAAVKAAAPDVHVAHQIQGSITTANIDALAGIKNAWASVAKGLILANPAIVSYAHARGVGVQAWTIEYGSEAADLMRAGVNVIIANQPIGRG